MFSNYALKEATILSLLTGIPSNNTQFQISRMVQMLRRILSPSTTLVSILMFSPSPSPKYSSKHKMIELTYNNILFLIEPFPLEN